MAFRAWLGNFRDDSEALEYRLLFRDIPFFELANLDVEGDQACPAFFLLFSDISSLFLNIALFQRYPVFLRVR